MIKSYIVAHILFDDANAVQIITSAVMPGEDVECRKVIEQQRELLEKLLVESFTVEGNDTPT